MTKMQTQQVVKVATMGFAVFSVVSTIRQARADKDGLQTMEAVLRAATLALSIAILVRNLRHEDDAVAELAGAPAATA